MKRSWLLLVIIFVCGGCFLPSGNPPPGNILHNPVPGEVTIRKPSDAVDYLVTALTVVLLEKCPGERIGMRMDRNSAELAMQIFHESSKISGNTMTYDEADWTVASELKEKSLSVTLSRKGEKVWSETLDCQFL